MMMLMMVIDVLDVCVDSRIHHTCHRPHHKSKGVAVGRRRGYRGDDVPHIPDDGWQVLIVTNCCCQSLDDCLVCCMEATLCVGLFFMQLCEDIQQIAHSSWSMQFCHLSFRELSLKFNAVYQICLSVLCICLLCIIVCTKALELQETLLLIRTVEHSVADIELHV